MLPSVAKQGGLNAKSLTTSGFKHQNFALFGARKKTQKSQLLEQNIMKKRENPRFCPNFHFQKNILYFSEIKKKQNHVLRFNMLSTSKQFIYV